MITTHALRSLALIIAATFTFAGTLAASSGPATAQSLFLPATASDTAAAASRSKSVPQAKRERLVRVDANVLTRSIAPAGADTAADRESRAKRLAGDSVRLNLFNDVSETFRRTDVKANADSGYIWEGEVPGKGVYEALLIVKNGTISGRVQLDDRLFSIDHVSGNVHRITELDPAKFPPEAPPAIPPVASGAQPNQEPEQNAAEEDTRANTVIRVLVAYTGKSKIEAVASGKNILTEINKAIALANQAYKRGGMALVLQLAGTPMQVNYNENPSIFEDLENVSNINTPTNPNAFAGVRSQRTARKADLVALFRKNDPSFCGIAWFPGSSPNAAQPMPSAATAIFGYSVMNWTCVTNLSFHHEIGHNMGARHDRYVDNAKPGYNHGFVNKPKKMRTVMAYADACSAVGLFCTRINWFSSSTIQATGGVVIGSAANDNTRRLKETKTAVSKYLQ
ncbi:MAG TPA: zinc-dependent metalloprotease family protein [Xanthobacteraceae bacterium]|nr:zinc-dependent metalloprotease family protein [Xanthobacteraceae bacterium]